MPVLNITIPEVDHNITRPIVLDVARQIRDIVGIDKDTPIIYVDKSDGTWQPGSTMNPTGQTILSAAKAIQIEVEEELEDEFFAPQTVNQPIEAPDFLDAKLGISVRPIYKQSKFTINFSFSSANRSEVVAWRNRAQMMAANTHVTALHVVKYHYFFSDAVWDMLHHFYSLREATAPYNQSWDHYIQEHITPRAIMIAAQDNRQRLGIQEEQGRIQGEFDFRAEPQKEERNGDRNTWTVNFTYTFHAARPELTAVRYPVIIHNQLIEEKYIPMMQIDHEAVKPRAGSITSVLSHFEMPANMQRMMASQKVAKWPEYDEWLADTPVPNCKMVASLLIGLSEETDNFKLLNLRDIGDFQIDEDVLDFISGVEHRWVTKLYCSPVQIALYRNEALQAWDSIEVKPNLDIILKVPKDFRSRYRICIYFSDDITKVDYRSIKRLVRFPKAACKLFKATNTTQGRLNAYVQHIDTRAFMDCVRPGGYTRQEVIDSIVWQKTVMNSYIDAWRHQDLTNPKKES